MRGLAAALKLKESAGSWVQKRAMESQGHVPARGQKYESGPREAGEAGRASPHRHAERP